jgi:autophagy-related protein 2
MAFFMPSSMGKRLLKYGLSYVDVLDLDSLDLDSLDISLGSKSVVEFNDVGVKLKVYPSCPLRYLQRHGR